MGSGYDVETERRHCPQHQHSRLTIGYRGGIHPLCQPAKATALCLVLLHHASIIYLQLAKIAAGGQKLLYMHSRILYQQQLQLASALRYGTGLSVGSSMQLAPEVWFPPSFAVCSLLQIR